MKKKLEQKKKVIRRKSVEISLNSNLQNFNQFNTLSICNMLISGKRFL